MRAGSKNANRHIGLCLNCCRQILLGGVALLGFNLSLARPADWYVWQSKLDASKTVCSQTSPGEGWDKLTGPYLDARCEKLRK